MAESDPIIGKLVSNYKVTGRLGQGGMGIVYKAHDVSLQRPAALKFLPPHMVDDEELVERFGREARSSARLNHPNIVTIYGVGKHEDLFYIAMELIEGQPLTALIESENKMAPHKAVKLMIQAAEGLVEAHGQNIIHRDIKPDNLMIEKSGRLKIMDFGLALPQYEDTKLTSDGMTLGTPQYMSPEQWKDSNVDARSDIFSLGVTFYEMLAGEPPFVAKTPLAIMRKVVDEPAPPLMEKNSQVTERLAAIVEKMMAKDPKDRFGSAALLKAELDAYSQGKISPSVVPEGFAGGDSEAELADLDQQSQDQRIQSASGMRAVPSSGAVPVAKEAPNRKPLFIGVGAVAVLAVLGIGAWVALGSGSSFGSPLFPKSDFVWIEPGEFQMGSPSTEAFHNAADETLHSVTLTKGFWMGKYEVTQAQWEAVMPYNPSGFKGSRFPVETVSWKEVGTFITKLNKESGSQFRLPTEAEWEYACRAGSTTPYCYGDWPEGLNDYAWYGANSGGRSHPVGDKKPNAWGLYDMHGNVWEWCQDWVAAYPREAVVDPTGPPDNSPNVSLRVGRGGSWNEEPAMLRAADRSASPPQGKGANLGFRLAL